MKIWIIRGKYNYEAVREVCEKFQISRLKKLTDGQYLYWTRKSDFEQQDKASIQSNKPSALRAFKRAKKHMELVHNKYITDIELVHLNIKLPNGD